MGAHAWKSGGMARHVYVIELDRAAGKRRDPRIPWVYVGSSSKSPGKRFEQHRSGQKAARLVKKFGLRLRPDLYEDLPSFRGSREVERAESKRAQELADCGFVAHCDGVSYGKDVADWSEWDAERLEPVLEHVDVAAAELLESAFKPLEPDQCARLLHGERGFWVPEYLDQDDPPPSYGLFAHVSLGALLERAEVVAGSSPAALRENTVDNA
jgi:hypothetical protein